MAFDFDVFFTTLFLLLFAHFLADFPLQGDYLSKAKNPRTRVREIWILAMLGHSMIHAGAVYLITGSFFFAFIQLATHFWIDWAKCMGKLGHDEPKAFMNDQLLHIAVLIVLAFLYGWA